MLLEKVENVKPENQQYKFAVNAKDYTGKHVIYIRWQRIDPVGEGFYSCSDVNIKDNHRDRQPVHSCTGLPPPPRGGIGLSSALTRGYFHSQRPLTMRQ